jgi:hypothetical protein
MITVAQQQYIEDRNTCTVGTISAPLSRFLRPRNFGVVVVGAILRNVVAIAILCGVGLGHPGIFPINLRPLLVGHFRLNVEYGPQFLRALALDHDGHGEAGQVEQRLDVHVIGRGDQIKQQLPVNFDKRGIPRLDQFREFVGGQGGLVNRKRKTGELLM